MQLINTADREEVRQPLIGTKKKKRKKRRKEEGAAVEKIKHMLNSIKTIIMAFVVGPEDSFVWWLCRAVLNVWEREGGQSPPPKPPALQEESLQPDDSRF